MRFTCKRLVDGKILETISDAPDFQTLEEVCEKEFQENKDAVTIEKWGYVRGVGHNKVTVRDHVGKILLQFKTLAE